MKETAIVEKERVELRTPVLIEGLPGLGLVGKIATEYLIRQLKAQKIAELYSPHYAYYVLVSSKGSIRLLRSEFHCWKNDKGGSDLILLTGDSQAQTIAGQYEVADAVLDYADKNNVRLVITVGGYRKEATQEPKVYASATSQGLLSRAMEAGAESSPPGSPIVGTAGLLIGLAKFRNVDAICFLAETPGYLPDPRAAKSFLKVLMRMLSFEVDLSGMDKEIHKSEQIEERMQKVEEHRRILEKRRRRMEEEKISYIS